jgi:hypothetical protein
LDLTVFKATNRVAKITKRDWIEKNVTVKIFGKASTSHLSKTKIGP